MKRKTLVNILWFIFIGGLIGLFILINTAIVHDEIKKGQKKEQIQEQLDSAMLKSYEDYNSLNSFNPQ